MTFKATRPADMQAFAQSSMQEIKVGTTKARYALNLFGDVSFGAASRSEGNLKPDPAFAVGVFDALFNADVGDKILMTSEVTFQYEPNAPFAELERLHLRYKPTKNLFLEVGRFHTDVGYWNVAYHHGKWLQLSIERPRAIALHGGIVPTHWIGAQVGGSIPIGKQTTINAVVSGGSARDPVGGGSHQSHGTAFTPTNGAHAKLEVAGLGLRDLRVGVAGVAARIQSELAFVRPSFPNQSLDEFIGNVYVAYPTETVTLIAEGYAIEHRTNSSANVENKGFGWRTYSAFAMLGYTVGMVTPYVRGEITRNEVGATFPDPFYIADPKSIDGPPVSLDLEEAIVGSRIDVSTWSALKLEYRVTSGQGIRRADLPQPVIHTGTVAWTFGI